METINKSINRSENYFMFTVNLSDHNAFNNLVKNI
jgi:hypothetical protein